MAIKVQRGDTLTSIAKANKTTVQAIAKANGIKNVNKIIAGQVLKNPITTQPVKTQTAQGKKYPKSATDKFVAPKTTTAPANKWDSRLSGTRDEVSKINKIVNAELAKVKPATPTTPKPTTPTKPPPIDGAVKPPVVPPVTPGLTLKDVQDMFNTNQSTLQKGYDERLASFERMMQEQSDFQKKQYDDMMNRFRYTSVQVNPSSLNTNARDGIHLFDPGMGQAQQTAPQPVSTGQAGQPVNTGSGYQMNDTLFRYLNNMWNGGF